MLDVLLAISLLFGYRLARPLRCGRFLVCRSGRRLIPSVDFEEVVEDDQEHGNRSQEDGERVELIV